MALVAVAPCAGPRAAAPAGVWQIEINTIRYNQFTKSRLVNWDSEVGYPVLQQLSEKKRVVFVLSDLEELTSPEVAEILAIPEATVRTRLFYARKELAVLLRGHKGFVDVKGLGALPDTATDKDGGR